MATSKILATIRSKAMEAVTNFVPAAGHSVMRHMANAGAKEAEITKVYNGKYNNEYGAAYFMVEDYILKEVHWFVKKSTMLEYIIIQTDATDGHYSLEIVFHRGSVLIAVSFCRRSSIVEVSWGRKK